MKRENIIKDHKPGDKFIDRIDEDCPLEEFTVISTHRASKKKLESLRESFKNPKVKSFSEKYDLDTGKRKDIDEL